MARKYFEQMLFDELELGNYPGFQRWYPTPNPVCYSIPDVHQDFRNVTRMNRYDLHPLDYYRQSYWMPQSLVFPGYETFCLLRRNDRRGFQGKNYHFSRDKRINGDRRLYPNRHEESNNYRVDRGKSSDFLLPFEKRYQQGWHHREAQQYQLSRDERNTSRLSYRNSNTELCPENIVIDQHLHNFKQMLASRNPSSDLLSVNENMSQTGSNVNENVMHVGSPVYCNTPDIEWKEQPDKSQKNQYSDGSQFPPSPNFDSSYASWYCPEEPQQIVDMLKEVNLRHDRQLRRDMLHSQGEQPSSGESMSSNNDSLVANCLPDSSSSSSEEDEDTVTILMHPVDVPSIPELINEQEDQIKSGYHEKSASDFFEEFQNIFTGSPEKKIINNLTKENLIRSRAAEEDDFEVLGRIITDDDKNAVKTVLDFDNIDDLTEKTFEKSKNISSSSPKESMIDNSVNEKDVPSSDKQNINSLKVLSDIKMDRDVFPSLDENTKSRSLKIANSKNSGSMEKIQPSNAQHMAFLKQKVASLHMNGNSQTTNDKNSPDEFMSDSNNTAEHSLKNILVTPIQNRRQSNNDSTKNINLNNIYTNESSGDGQSPQETTCNINHQAKKSYEIKSQKIETLLYDDVKNLSVTSKDIEFIGPDNNNKKNSMGSAKCSQETDILYSNNNNSENSEACLYPNGDLRKEEGILSMSEPILMHKRNDVVYKRISLSEIFNSVNTKPEKNFEKTPINMRSKHRALSPSEHLKQILGIGKNTEKRKSESNTHENNFSKESPLNKNKCSQDLKAKSGTLSNSAPSKECRNILKASIEASSPKYPCCMSIQDSAVKEHMHHKNPSSKVEACNPEVSKNRKKFQKRRKPLEKVDNSFMSSNNNLNHSQKEYDASMNGVPACKFKNGTEHNSSIPISNKSIFKKGVSYKESHIAKQSNCQICETQPDVADLPAENLKSKQKVIFDEHTEPQKSSQQTEANNTPRLINDSSNKYKKEQTKEGSSKYTKRRKDLKDKEPSSDLDDSQLPLCNGKEFEESLIPTISKLDLIKTRKKFKKKKKKEKFVNEYDCQEIKQISTRSNEVEQIVKRNDTLEISSGNQNKYKSSKSETSEEKSRQSTVINSTKNASLTSQNIADNPYENVKCETDGGSLENFNEKSLKSFIDVTNTEPNLKLKPPEFKEINTSANTEKKSFRVVKSVKVKDNKGKFDYSIKGHELPETSKYWKNKACSSERNYPFLEKKIMTLAYNGIRLPREHKSHKYVRHNHLEDNKSTTVKESNSFNEFIKNIIPKEPKRNSFKKLKKMTPEESNLKTDQNARFHEVKKDLSNSSLKKDISTPSKAVSASKAEVICPSTNLEDKICSSESSNAIYANKTSSNQVAEDISFSQPESLSYFPVNSELLAIMKNIRYKTQQMLEEAEKIAYFARKGKAGVSFPQECKLELNAKQQNHYGNHLVSKANTELSSISVKKDSFDYPFIHLIQKENSNSNRICTKSLKLTALGALRKMKQSRCMQFSKDISCVSIYTKEKEDVIKRPVSTVQVHSMAFRKETFEEQVPSNIPQNIIVIAPIVMENYLRNKQALKLNHLLDVHVEVHLQNFLSDFNSVKSSPPLQNSLQLSLGAVISKNLIHTLPLLLNSLSLLSKFDIPWTRDSLKELLEVCYFCGDKRTDSKRLKSRGEEISQNYANEVLSCWDLISNYFTNTEVRTR